MYNPQNIIYNSTMINIFEDYYTPKLITELDIENLDFYEIKDPLEWLMSVSKDYTDRRYFGMFCLYFGINKEKTNETRAYNLKEITEKYASLDLTPSLVDKAVKKFVNLLKILIALNRAYSKMENKEELVLLWMKRMKKKENFMTFCKSVNIDTPIYLRPLLIYLRRYYGTRDLEG